MNILNELQTAQVEALYKKYGRTDLSRSEINDMVKSGEISNPSWLKNKKYLVFIPWIVIVEISLISIPVEL